MSRDQGPADCCTYACTQGRNCPARCTLNTADGGQKIDTETDLDSVYHWVDQIVNRGRWAALTFAVVSLGLSTFYLFY